MPFVPLVPFCASTTGADQSLLVMVSVAVSLNAVAAITYIGFVPVGISVAQLLSIVPDNVPVLKVYVKLLFGLLGVDAALWYR